MCGALVATAVLASQLVLIAAVSLPEPAQCWQVRRLAETLLAFADLARRDAMAEAREYNVEAGLVKAFVEFLDAARRVASYVEGACRSLSPP